MKRKLFLLLCALLTMIGVQAQGTWTAPEIPGSNISSTSSGNYAIYNIKADAFMGEGMNYGTEALACRLEGGYSAGLANRQKFTLSVSNGKVKMVHVNHTNRGVGCASVNANDIYADYGSNNQWTFASSNTAPDYGNVYNLSIAGFGTLDVDDKWGGKLTTTGGPGNTDWAFIPEGKLTDGSFAKWVERKAMYDIYLALVASESTSTYASALSTANAVYTNNNATVSQLRAATRALIIAAADGIQQPTNVSALFTNANMQQDGTGDWTTTAVDRSGGAIEKFHASITLTQAKNDVPDGLYTLVFRGMARQDGGSAAPIFNATSGNASNNANVPWMTSIASRWNVRGGNNNWAGNDGSKIPDRLWRAAEGLAYDEATASIENFKVTGNSLTLTVTQSRNDQWFTFNSFEIIYSGPANLAIYKQVVEKKSVAEGLVSTAPNAGSAKLLTDAIEEAGSVSPSSEEDALNHALTALNTAITFAGECGTPYATFTALKDAADDIADVEYTETESGSHSTFTGTISAQSSTANNATTVATITTATSTLKAAIETYIKGAEPKNDGEYFDITCLMANPDFDDNTITGWTKESSMNPNTRIQCNEFYGSAAFDFYQTVNGLPNGSYTLSMKAFQRPGGYNDVYAAWKDGINNATAKVYVNSDESDVKNIMAEMNATRIYTDPAGEDAFNSDKKPTGADGYIPNSMEGASAWFAADKYKTEVAALVEDGSLKLGFKDAAHSGDVWTLFDEFRLHYYGSSKLVYYKQYLPQLKAEVSADLTNNLYKNVLVSSEDEALVAALAAMPASETEEAYKTVIDNIKAAQTAFRAAAPSYDAMVAAKASSITKISGNIGTGVFQYDETTNNSLFSAYETAKSPVDSYEFTTSSTAAGAQTLVDALNTAINNYQNQALNAPNAEKRYWLSIVDNGQAWNGYAVTFIAGGRDGMGDYAIKYLAPASVNMDQAIKFVAVPGEANTYKLSGVRAENGGEQYISTGVIYEGGSNTQIRTTDDVEKALLIKIQATTTEGQFKLLNTADGNKVIARNAGNPDNGMYTDGDNSFTIVEASKAEVKLQVSNDKLGTFVAPFDITLPEKVKAYSATATETEVTLKKIAEGGDELKAGTPVVVYGDGADVEVTFNKYAIFSKTENPTVDDNALVGLLVDKNVPAGAYVLQTQAGNQGFYKVTGTEAVPGVFYRSYLIAASPNARLVITFDGEDPTAINAIEAAETEDGVLKDGKYLIDGKVILVKNGVKYSANGQILK